MDKPFVVEGRGLYGETLAKVEFQDYSKALHFVPTVLQTNPQVERVMVSQDTVVLADVKRQTWLRR